MPTENKEKEVKVSKSVSREEFDNLAAKVRRMSDNWKKFCKMQVGHDVDGKVGSIKLNVVIGLCLICVGVTMLFAANGWNVPLRTGGAGATFDIDTGVLTAPTISGTTAITTDDVNERTSGAGVTIDNDVKIKDGDVLFEGTATSEMWVGAPIMASMRGVTAGWSTYIDDFYVAGYTPNVTATNYIVASDTIVPNTCAKFSEVADRGAWLATVADANPDNGETITVLDDAPGGILKILNNDGTNDRVSVQMNGEAFKLATGKKLYFEASFAISDADKNDVFVGLGTADTAFIGGLPNDHIGFIAHHDGNLDITVSQDGSNSLYDTGVDLSDISGVTNLTTVAFYWNGAGTVETYVRGNGSGSMSVSTQLVNTVGGPEIPDDEAMSPCFEIHNTDAAADYMYVDNLIIAQEP